MDGWIDGGVIVAIDSMGSSDPDHLLVAFRVGCLGA
jgi:hypothetical protein